MLVSTIYNTQREDKILILKGRTFTVCGPCIKVVVIRQIVFFFCGEFIVSQSVNVKMAFCANLEAASC